MNFILFGPPGAGKGTQAKELAKELNIAHISTGDLLRQNAALGTLLGKEAKGYMDRGALVPDELVTKMLGERFEKPDVKNGFILDGYPRTLNQAKSLGELLKSKTMNIDFAAYLDTSDAVIIQRLSGRLVCKKCGSNFHITNMPPKTVNICDHCQGELYQRGDDKVETIKKRIEVYKNEASEVLNYYEAQNKLHTLSADKEAKIVLKQLIYLAIHPHDPLKV
ncbi:MAG: adenylate kinase [Candidatus Omnitrophota bacterium]